MPRKETIEYPDFNGPKTEFKKLEVVYIRRVFDPVTDVGKPFAQGWYVCRADNGRRLGWVISPTERGDKSRWWAGYVHAGAFRGDSINDDGDALDKVSDSLTRNTPEWGGPWETDTRQSFAYNLLCHLSKHRAPALGFPRKPDDAWNVERYKPRTC